MTGSANYKALKTKYRGFGAPTVRIHIDGVDITEKKDAKLAGVSVDLSAEFSASGASFDVVCEYEPKNTAFSAKGAAAFLQLGAKVELELGYIETETVFYGLIVEVEAVFEDGNAPFIHVECMDAKCLLMKRRRLALFSNKTPAELVGDILSDAPFSDYIKGKKVDAAGEKLDMLPTAMEDDFQFTQRCARRLGCEFFIAQGTVYFRKAPDSASPIMALGPQTGLITLKQSLRGVSLYKKTLVVGVNPADDKAVSGEASLNAKFGDGAGPKRMLGQSEKVLFDHRVASAEQAQQRAKELMREAQGGFGGRSVSIDGVSPQADRDYYILSVRHTVDERGFFTTIGARLTAL